MGTRADFWIYEQDQREWLGSVALDGYVWAEIGPWYSMAPKESALHEVTSPDAFREAVNAALSSRYDATLPEMGWPWPWNDSGGTDYAYVFEDGLSKVYRFGRPMNWGEKLDWNAEKRRDWSNMKHKANVQFSGSRSGLVTISSK